MESLVLFSKDKVPLDLKCKLRLPGGKVGYDYQIIEWLTFIEPLKTNLPRDGRLVASSGYGSQQCTGKIVRANSLLEVFAGSSGGYRAGDAFIFHNFFQSVYEQ